MQCKIHAVRIWNSDANFLGCLNFVGHADHHRHHSRDSANTDRLPAKALQNSHRIFCCVPDFIHVQFRDDTDHMHLVTGFHKAIIWSNIRFDIQYYHWQVFYILHVKCSFSTNFRFIFSFIPVPALYLINFLITIWVHTLVSHNSFDMRNFFLWPYPLVTMFDAIFRFEIQQYLSYGLECMSQPEHISIQHFKPIFIVYHFQGVSYFRLVNRVSG